MPFPPIEVNNSAKMKNVPVFFLIFVFLFIICISNVSGIDPDAILPNTRSQHHVTFMGRTKPWIPLEVIPTTQGYAKKYQPNHEVKQHAQNNPYSSDPNLTLDIIPRRGDSTDKLLKRINRAFIGKPEEKLYQDQINAKVIYDRKHKENIEAIFQSFAFETDDQVTNIYNGGDAKANMEAVFGISTTELEENKKSKSFIDNSTLMDQIADIFGPPPSDSNNLHFKRKIDEKSYQGSLQAAIYNSFGPEVLEPSGTSDEGDILTLTMEDDGHIADNYDLHDRYPPPSYMEAISRENHNTSTTTQGPSPAESTPESRQISKKRPGLDYPGSSATGHLISPSPKPMVIPSPPPTSTSSIASSSTSHDGVDDSTSSTPTAPSRNGASAQKANLILLNSCCFFFMATLVATVVNL